MLGGAGADRFEKMFRQNKYYYFYYEKVYPMHALCILSNILGEMTYCYLIKPGRGQKRLKPPRKRADVRSFRRGESACRSEFSANAYVVTEHFHEPPWVDKE